MKILTAEEMGAADRRTEEEFAVSLESLMEQAGGAVATFCLRQYGAGLRVTGICGGGNNGGEGFVAARGFLLGGMDEVKGEAAAALRRLRGEASVVLVDEVVDEVSLTAASSALGDAALVIDAVVGTGFKPPLRGLAVSVREMLEGLDVPVVAVDLPSG